MYGIIGMTWGDDERLVWGRPSNSSIKSLENLASLWDNWWFRHNASNWSYALAIWLRGYPFSQKVSAHVNQEVQSFRGPLCCHICINQQSLNNKVAFLAQIWCSKWRRNGTWTPQRLHLLPQSFLLQLNAAHQSEFLRDFVKMTDWNVWRILPPHWAKLTKRAAQPDDSCHGNECKCTVFTCRGGRQLFTASWRWTSVKTWA